MFSRGIQFLCPLPEEAFFTDVFFTICLVCAWTVGVERKSGLPLIAMYLLFLHIGRVSVANNKSSSS